MLHYWPWLLINGENMVRVKVKISHLVTNFPNKPRGFYKTGDEFECTDAQAEELKNAVTVLKDLEEPASVVPLKKAKTP